MVYITVVISIISFSFIVSEGIILNIKDEYSTFVLEGIIGSRASHQKISFDITKPISFVYNNEHYSPNMSKTYRLVEEIANVGIKSIDVLRITNFKIKNFTFIYRDNNTSLSIFKPYLGLGRGNESFIEELYTEKLISNRNFGFFTFEDNKTVYYKIFFGKVFKHKQISFCHMKDNNYKYSCMLSAIKANSSEISFHKLASFETKNKYIIFPITYMEEFKEKYLTRFYYDNNCLTIDDYTRFLIYCNNDTISSLPNLTFSFDEDVNIEISPYDLFEEVSANISKYKMKIEFGTYNQTEISFGSWFVMKHKMTFDNDNNIIIFDEHEKQTQFINSMFIVYISIIVLMSLGNIFLIQMKLTYNI